MDTLTFTTFDGNSFTMDATIFAYEVFPGPLGAPPTQFATRQGYKQHGVTEIDYTLQPRDFDLEFWRAPACDRLTYWSNRAELLDFLRPNRNGPMVFTITREDHTQRSLHIRATPGAQFPGQQANDWNIRETLSFTAFDPIWYDPAVTTYTPASSSPTQLVFPITFPIQFGAGGLQFLQAVTYGGSWKSYPTLTLSGPYTAVTIENSVIDAAVFLTVSILAGEQRIITLTPGQQTVVDGLGANKFGDLGPLSDLVNFALMPDPEAPGGVQTVSIIMIGGSAGVSSASFSYQNRYFGI